MDAGEVRRRLQAMWPSVTIRSTTDEERTMFVISSINAEIPPSMAWALPSYEERYLFYVLALARAPRTRLVYVTSMPVLDRLVDYELGLLDHLDVAAVRRRMTFVSLGDPSPRPLTQKLLERPRAIERLRSFVTDPERTLLLPFNTTAGELELASLLDVPFYGPDPALAHLGTKTGSREVFAAAGVPLPFGVHGIRDLGDVCEAVDAIRAARPGLAGVVIKLDDGFSGLGNATVDVAGAASRAEVEARVLAMRGDGIEAPEQYLEALARRGGIVEERLRARRFASPSVQLRASPFGDVEVLSTHDQLLGGVDGQTFFGCTFPCDPGYGPELVGLGRAVGEQVAKAGVIGRFAVDFVATRDADGDPWQLHAIEINLRNGGTTHPMLTLQALVDAPFDETTGTLCDASGTPKHYLATDHLESPSYRRLTPDDVIDLTCEPGLGWDPETRTGTAVHMVSAVAAGGRLGLTAIGDSAAQAQAVHDRFKAALDGRAGAA